MLPVAWQIAERTPCLQTGDKETRRQGNTSAFALHLLVPLLLVSYLPFTPSRPTRQLIQASQRCAQGRVQAAIDFAVELIVKLLGRRLRVECCAHAGHSVGGRARVIIPSG